MACRVRRIAANAVVAHAAGTTCLAGVGPECVAVGSIRIDAATFLLSDDRLAVVAASACEVGAVQLSADVPVSLRPPGRSCRALPPSRADSSNSSRIPEWAISVSVSPIVSK